MNDDYKTLVSMDTSGELNAYSATGFSSTIISSRVSYFYNLHGPCMTLDTACSSALIAIHLGCQAIKTGKYSKSQLKNDSYNTWISYKKAMKFPLKLLNMGNTETIF